RVLASSDRAEVDGEKSPAVFFIGLLVELRLAPLAVVELYFDFGDRSAVAPHRAIGFEGHFAVFCRATRHAGNGRLEIHPRNRAFDEHDLAILTLATDGDVVAAHEAAHVAAVAHFHSCPPLPICHPLPATDDH